MLQKQAFVGLSQETFDAAFDRVPPLKLARLA
jgi:hypothetical protein